MATTVRGVVEGGRVVPSSPLPEGARVEIRLEDPHPDVPEERKPLVVSDGGTAGPYLRLPYSRVDEVRRLLDEHRIRYWVDEHVISLDGGPEIAVIHLGREVGRAAAQAILDGAR